MRRPSLQSGVRPAGHCVDAVERGCGRGIAGACPDIRASNLGCAHARRVVREPGCRGSRGRSSVLLAASAAAARVGTRAPDSRIVVVLVDVVETPDRNTHSACFPSKISAHQLCAKRARSSRLITIPARRPHRRHTRVIARMIRVSSRIRLRRGKLRYTNAGGGRE